MFFQLQPMFDEEQAGRQTHTLSPGRTQAEAVESTRKRLTLLSFMALKTPGKASPRGVSVLRMKMLVKDM